MNEQSWDCPNKTSPSSVGRASNFEWLRIFAMFAIVTHHAAVHGAVNVLHSNTAALPFYQAPQVNRVATVLALPGGPVGVALFFMLTGYFLAGKRDGKLRRVLSTVVFYGWFFAAMLAVAQFFAPFSGTNRSLLSRSFWGPVSGRVWWFATAYAVLILLVPSINAILNRLNAIGLFLACGFVFLFWTWRSHFFYPQLALAVFFYAFGTFCVMVPVGRGGFRAVYLLLAVAGWLLSAWRMSPSGASPPAHSLSPLLAATTAFFLFQFFRTLPDRVHPRVNAVSATVFGIYLLHDFPLSRRFIWNSVFHVADKQFASPMFPLWLLLDSLAVFAICAALEALRIRFVAPMVDKMLDLTLRLFRRFACRPAD